MFFVIWTYKNGLDKKSLINNTASAQHNDYFKTNLMAHIQLKYGREIVATYNIKTIVTYTTELSTDIINASSPYFVSCY